jgi:hypothetical protein
MRRSDLLVHEAEQTLGLSVFMNGDLAELRTWEQRTRLAAHHLRDAIEARETEEEGSKQIVLFDNFKDNHSSCGLGLEE